MSIDYNHEYNSHRPQSPALALPFLLSGLRVTSMLDVGCGLGTWIRAAQLNGIADVFGIDGEDMPPGEPRFDSTRFKQCDLTTPVDLGRKFDVALCLEVAEHLDSQFALVLIETLARHSDMIIFSAACPGQAGQHHVNCQWPDYWQNLFNSLGYACEDTLRWRIWSITDIEPWYRQNIFLALKAPDKAGKEPRIPGVLHPDFFQDGKLPNHAASSKTREEYLWQIQQGSMPSNWYFTTACSGISNKLRRHLLRRKSS